MWLKHLKQIVENSDSREGQIFDLVIQVLIVISIVSFSLETLPNLSIASQMWLNSIEAITVSIFTIEYLLRLFFAEHKLRFIFSFFGLIDLLSILPFYISPKMDLRSMRMLRVLRLLRIFRAFKLARYNKTIHRFYRALLIAKEELILFLFVTILLMYMSAVGIYYCEHDAQPEVFASVFHSLWWAVATLTTVGYGDIYPVTTGGKIFTFIILLIGLGVISLPAGVVASALTKAREMED